MRQIICHTGTIQYFEYQGLIAYIDNAEGKPKWLRVLTSSLGFPSAFNVQRSPPRPAWLSAPSPPRQRRWGNGNRRHGYHDDMTPITSTYDDHLEYIQDSTALSHSSLDLSWLTLLQYDDSEAGWSLIGTLRDFSHISDCPLDYPWVTRQSMLFNIESHRYSVG